ncbi:MAG: YtxH domain-containing protein [Ignavibacteria bacterium]|nr:YtxH domain-containing protein [Ignavibacteria bacterium]
MASNGNEYFKGFILGSIFGGAVGAFLALLFAPKSGREFRKELADKTNELYRKASNYLTDVEQKIDEQVWETVNEGKIRAQSIIETAKQQAQKILEDAERIIQEAKEKAFEIKETVEDKIDQIKEATKAGVEAFKSEMKE